MITPYYPHFISWLAIVCQPGVPSEFPGTDPFGRGDDEQTRGEYQDPPGTGVGSGRLRTGGRRKVRKKVGEGRCFADVLPQISIKMGSGSH